MSEIEELFWLIFFIVGCVGLIGFLILIKYEDRFFKWWAKKDAEMQREAELERRMGRK